MDVDGEEVMDELVFVGSGVSTGIPILGHLDGSCDTCSLSLKPNNLNRRNNVSLLINIKERKKKKEKEGEEETTPDVNVLIDVGKTFRDAFLNILSSRSFTHLDALLVTHDHADASAGLDEVHNLQTFTQHDGGVVCSKAVPCFLSEYTLNTMKTQFPDVIKASTIVNDTQQQPQPQVLSKPTTSLLFHLLDDTKPTPFSPHPSFPPFTALPVVHGDPYICLGYSFGVKTTVVYLSDVSSIPTNTMDYIMSLCSPKPIDILIIDCLLPSPREHYSHFCIDQMWDCVKTIKPKKAYGVGMYCSLEHHATNKLLNERFEALNEEERGQMESVELAYDGMVLKVPLI